VTTASHLVGHEGISAIHIATGKRPNYDDLVRYRTLANVEGLHLTVEANALVMRRDAEPEELALPTQPNQPTERRPRQVAQIAVRTWHWASAHLSTWHAGFAGTHEGVR
jgi:hypothetical protein